MPNYLQNYATGFPAPPPTTIYPSSTINPAPQPGSGAFGAVPGPIGLPNPAGDLAAQFPNLAGANRSVSGDIMSELGGQLSPGTQNMLQDLGAAWSIGSGMPGSQFGRYRTARDLGLMSEQLSQQGLRDYASLIPTISRTQTVSPELQTEIATQNAINRAAPDPTQAASYAKQLFDQYLSALRGPAGGTGRGGFTIGGGGFGPTAPPTPASWAADRMALTGPIGGPVGRGGLPGPGGLNIPGANDLSPEDLAYYFSAGSLPGAGGAPTFNYGVPDLGVGAAAGGSATAADAGLGGPSEEDLAFLGIGGQ